MRVVPPARVARCASDLPESRQVNGTSRIVVLPQPGRRYLVGVSSFEGEGVGDYTVSFVNDGTLAPY